MIGFTTKAIGLPWPHPALFSGFFGMLGNFSSYNGTMRPRAGGLPPARGCALVLLPCCVWNIHSLQCQLLFILRETFANTCLHCPWSGRNWPQASSTDYRGEVGGARTSVSESHLLVLHPGRQGGVWSEWRERPQTWRLRVWGLWSDESVGISAFPFHNRVSLVHGLHLFQPQYVHL